MPEVTDLPVPAPVPDSVEARKAQALEDQAAQMRRQADAAASIAAAAGAVGDSRAARFERVLCACVEGRVATTVEGFLSFARELCDGIDREFPST